MFHSTFIVDLHVNMTSPHFFTGVARCINMTAGKSYPEFSLI
jgi:hypothetical protein